MLLPLDPAAVRAVLPQFFRGVEVHASLPTTMDRAVALAAAGAPEGTLVLADEQTAGRGRLDRVWVAPPGAGLLLSAVLRPRCQADAAWTVVALAATALAGACRAVLAGTAGAGADVGLKWPNDLLIDGRKAAGLLAQLGLDPGGSAQVAWVVIGMGVNVSQTADDFPPAVRQAATSLRQVAVGRIDRLALLGAWAERFAEGYEATWLRQTSSAAAAVEAARAAYHADLRTLGRDVRVKRATLPTLTGRAVDVTAAGALVIATVAGTVEVSAGEVTHLRHAEHA